MSAAPLAGKVALITGGSKGIGAALSTRLATLGASVAINYSSDTNAATNLVNTLNGSHPTDKPHIAIQADAGSVAGAEHMVATTVQQFGKIDLLLCCAGVLSMRTLEATSEADFDKSYALNVKGPYFLAQKAVPHMPTAKAGEDSGSRIIFFSTSLTAASTVQPAYLLYNSTKGAVEQISRVLSKDLNGKGITVNTVSPGPTRTELFLKGKSDEMVAGLGKLNPRGRIGDPEEVADAISLLCGPESRWISGQTLRINGGMA